MKESTREALGGAASCAIVLSVWLVPIVAGVAIACTTSVRWWGGVIFALFLMWFLPTVIKRGFVLVSMFVGVVTPRGVPAWRRVAGVLTAIVYAVAMLSLLATFIVVMLSAWRAGYQIAGWLGVGAVACVLDATLPVVVLLLVADQEESSIVTAQPKDERNDNVDDVVDIEGENRGHDDPFGDDDILEEDVEDDDDFGDDDMFEEAVEDEDSVDDEAEGLDETENDEDDVVTPKPLSDETVRFIREAEERLRQRHRQPDDRERSEHSDRLARELQAKSDALPNPLDDQKP